MIYLPRVRAIGAFVLTCSALCIGAAAQAPSRLIGTVTSTGQSKLALKTDAGQSYDVNVPDGIDIKRIAPGERDLSKAAPMPFSDLTVGDRALVKLDSSAPAGALQAIQIIAIKNADVAQKQAEDRAAWQTHGTGGLVKSVDPSLGVIQITTGTGPTAKTIAVHVSEKTALKRYANGSVHYDDAKPAPISAIQPGDQLRARGDKNADGTELTADEVVSGSFRNISGVVNSVDAGSGTLVVRDLATKKDITVHLPQTAQMKRLPETMAKMLAAALKAGGAASPQAGAAAGGPSSNGERMHAQGRGGDLQNLLNRAPTIGAADLKKGDAVMLVSTQGAEDVTAITLLAGVEPLLEAPAESQNLLANWSMGSGGAEAAAQ